MDILLYMVIGTIPISLGYVGLMILRERKGALFLALNDKFSSKLIKYGTPFAAGVLLMAAFYDLIPEGIVEGGTDVINATLAAIILFFLLEKGFQNFHHHHEEDVDKQKDTTQGWLFLVGDVFHNLIDGISLGAAFLIGGRDTGLIATLALVAHDIPLEVGEFVSPQASEILSS